MKKRIAISILIFLFIMFILLLFYNPEEKIRISSFERFYNGEETENILAWNKVENVEEYEVILYDKDQNIISELTTQDEQINIEDVNLVIDDRFFAVVTAKTKSGKQITSNQYGTTWKKETNKVSEVTSNRKSGEVRGRKKIILKTSSPKAVIYYTMDGSNPTINSKKYTKPIELKESVIIKCFAVKDGFEDSEISSFSYNVKSTKPIVYLSPSTQEYNKGIKGSNYTTEEDMMNKVTDVIEPILKKNDIEVYRNKPSMTSKGAIKDSRKYDVDLHLAIHSNASPENKRGRYTGVETWIYDENCSEAEEIAIKLQQSIIDLYYNKYGDRGVLYSVEMGGLGETNPYNVNNGILMELAFHDNWNDAVWMVKNINKIGKAIAKTIIDYYK